MSVEYQMRVQECGDLDTTITPEATEQARVAEADAQAIADQALPHLEDADRLRAERDNDALIDQPPTTVVIPTDARGESEVHQGPLYERLQREGEAGAALMPYLTRLGVLSNDYDKLYNSTSDIPGDEIDRGLVDRLSDADGAQGNKNVSQLNDALELSLREITACPELLDGGELNWLGLGSALLDRAEAEEDHPENVTRQSLLRSATIAVLMAENPDDRITFLDETFKRGLSHAMERALDRSEISIVFGPYRNSDVTNGGKRTDRNIHRLRNFYTAFQGSHEDVVRYRELVERDLGEYVDAHEAMNNATADYATLAGMLGSGHDRILEDASVRAAYVDRYRVDPTKAERFALEKLYVVAQMAELFPDGDAANLQAIFAEDRPAVKDADDAIRRLFLHAQLKISSLSQPVNERFMVPEGQPTDSWTREQLAAWRYKQLAVKGITYDDIVKFVDPTVFRGASNFRNSIYEISENGAALPGMATEAVRIVLAAANEYTAETGKQVTAAELRDLTQAKRRQLMRVAAINMDHLSASLVKDKIRNQNLYKKTQPPLLVTKMCRKPDGRLDLDGPLFEPETALTQSGTRLACVALQVHVQARPGVVEASGRNKINSIERLAEVVIDEAYERGIFQAGLAQAA